MSIYTPLIKGKKILVTGGTGTVGQALVKRLIKEEAKVVRIFSRDEHKQFLMQEQLDFLGISGKNYRFLLGDVRDQSRLNRAMEDIDLVFHLAALKHVPACEYNPYEAVKTNVIGTQNIIDCAISNGVKAVVYASTDKAAAPTNTMGASKLLAERLISAMGEGKGAHEIKFMSVRFGNVLNSRGSVVPLFHRQIMRGGPVTVTDAKMTRFFMGINHAVELILKALSIAKGGETFVFKMPVLQVGDLAQAMIETAPHPVEQLIVGLRPGEKMYEELMSEEESARALDMQDMFVILPFYQTIYAGLKNYTDAQKAPLGVYSSSNEKLLSIDNIKELLHDLVLE